MSFVTRVLTFICLAASITMAGCAAEAARKGGAAPKGPVEYCRPAVQAPDLGQTSLRTGIAPAVEAQATERAESAAPALQASSAAEAIPASESVSSAESVPGEPATTAALVAGATQSASFAPLHQLFFDFDSYLLTPGARSTLDLLYEKLGSEDGFYTLEGYCDERGDDDYNLALGERRAAAARAYLVSRGIKAERLRIISYGREFPADPAPTEEAYQRNRRVEVVDADAPGPDSEARYGLRE